MLKFALQYESVEVFVREFTGKISTKGLSLKTAKPIEIGDKVGLLFKIKQGDGVFTAQGEVAWIDDADAETGKKGLIIRNIALDAESKRMVSEYMATEVVDTQGAVPVGAPANVTASVAARPRPAKVRTPTPVYAPAPKKRWPLVLFLTLLLLGGVGGAFGYWYVELGGEKIIAEFFVEEREGRVTGLQPADNAFLMGLATQRSSDWYVQTTGDTEWVGLRGLGELQEEDRILLSYRPDGDAYVAWKVELRQRTLTGEVVDIIDAGAGILEIAHDEGPLELTGESNASARNVIQQAERGDIVRAQYSLDDEGKRHIRDIAVIERTATGPLVAVDASARTLRVELASGEVELSATDDTVLDGDLSWSDLGEKDRVKIQYSPDRGRIQALAMVEKYVAPPTPAPRRPAPTPPQAVLNDIIHSADDRVARFALDFNRRISFEGPTRLEEPARYVVRVSNARSAFPRSEVFLSDAPLRTLRVTPEGRDLVLTFLITSGYTPRPDVRVEGERLVALFFAR